MFNWDVIEHEYENRPYEFEADGKKWRLPHPNDLNIGQVRAADAGMFEILFNEVVEVQDADGEWVHAGKAGAELIIGKHQDQIGILKTAWIAHAGLKPGESPASSS